MNNTTDLSKTFDKSGNKEFILSDSKGKGMKLNKKLSNLLFKN